MWFQSPDEEDPMEEEMATYSSILAWRIPWTEEPGRLQFIGSQSQTRLKQVSMHTCILLLNVSQERKSIIFLGGQVLGFASLLVKGSVVYVVAE